MRFRLVLRLAMEADGRSGSGIAAVLLQWDLRRIELMGKGGRSRTWTRRAQREVAIRQNLCLVTEEVKLVALGEAQHVALIPHRE